MQEVYLQQSNIFQNQGKLQLFVLQKMLQIQLIHNFSTWSPELKKNIT